MFDPKELSRFNFATGTNAAYIESLYEQYKSDPGSVDESFRKFFEGYDFASKAAGISFQTVGVSKKSSPPVGEEANAAKVEAYINAYRRIGHLNAHLNPLREEASLEARLDAADHHLEDIKDSDVFHPANLPRDTYTFGEIKDLLENTYCRYIGADFRELNDIEAVIWFQEKMESCQNSPQLSKAEKLRIHNRLMAAEGFEKFLQDRYLGQKRFSVEGNDALIPLLDFLADHAARNGVEEINLGMAHRGRLNVLANFMNKSFEQLLKEFEGTEFNPFDIDGDVKYHMGFASEVETFSGHKLKLYLSPNPSHLEAVNPVLEGFTRGRQDSS